MGKHEDKHKDEKHKHEVHNESTTDVHIESTITSSVSSSQFEELEADLKRIQADFINFKRRTDSERAELMNMAKASVVMEMLPMIDNLERALMHQPEDLAENPWVQGVGQVAKQFENTLEKLGLTKVGIVGERFDPNKHEAISIEDGDGETDVIAEVLQSGYKLGERVLRPAMVKVTRK